MSDETKRAFYAVIPANVRYDKSLKPNAKLLYGEITALCNAKGCCWASNEYFANLYGVGIKTISTWITELVKKGYLNRQITYKPNSKEIEARILTLPIALPPSLKKERGYPENNGEGKTGEEIDITGQNRNTPPSRKNRRGIPKITEENITNEYNIFITEVINNHFPENKNFIPLVEKWLKYKKEEKKQTYKSENSLKIWIKNLIKFSGGNFEKAEEIIDEAIANLWMGIQKPKEKNISPANSQQRERVKTLKFESTQTSLNPDSPLSLSVKPKFGGY